jgi:hypothetical protein
MADQPARVTPGEISALLDQVRQLTPDCDPGERLAYFDRKADLLTRVAEDLGTIDAHEVAAGARAYAAALRSGLDPATLGEVR